MAEQRIPILGWGTVPDASGDVYLEPYDVSATNDKWKRLVWVFVDPGSNRRGLRGSFEVPSDYLTDSKLKIVWTSTVTSGNVEWDFDYRAVGGNDVESLDQTGTQETVNLEDAAPSAAHERLEHSIDLTQTNFAAHDTVTFELFRDGTDAGDTMVGDALVFEVLFSYDDGV